MTLPLNFNSAIQEIVKEEWGQLLSLLIIKLNDIQLCEDVLQDAAEAALHHWRKNGLPKHPRAWLLKTAKHKAIDRIRRDINFHKKQKEYQYLLEIDQAEEIKEDQYEIPDERLRLIFTCCHPALDQKISVALTLQLVGGLTTSEIARAFLVKPETMAQRLVRGKRKIKHAGIPYIIPQRAVFSERLDTASAVLYLIFNEGYSASSGTDHIRKELCQEAIRLAKLLSRLCPEEPEVKALLALMLLHDSRRPARYTKDGDFVPLQDQDRTLWLKESRDQGLRLLQSALK